GRFLWQFDEYSSHPLSFRVISKQSRLSALDILLSQVPWSEISEREIFAEGGSFSFRRRWVNYNPAVTDELIADAAFGNTAAFARLFHFTGTLLGVGEIRFIHLHNALERGDGLHVLESGQYL